MPHVIDGQSDVFQWKAQLRERVEGNLELILRDAHAAYKRKISEASFSGPGVPYRLEQEYRQDVQNLRRMAEEDLQAEIEREQRERNWALQRSTEEVDQAVIEEQLVIMNQIRRSVVPVHGGRTETYSGSIFHQETSSHNHFSPESLCISSTRSGTQTDALLPAGRNEKQQEEFRKRAQAIQERKRRERQASMQDDWSESIGSPSSDTSVSDHETGAHAANVLSADLDVRMAEEDIVDLITFHEQQWIFISTLPHLQWTDFPWPVLSFSRPKRIENLTVEAVVEYVSAPLTVKNDHAVMKDRLKDLIRRWHPDRFETKYLFLVTDWREREMVREGAGIVARILNDLLRKWSYN